MAESKKPAERFRGKRAADWIMPVAAVALVFVMLVPLPAFAARPAAGHQHHRFGAGAAVGGAHSAAGAVLGFSQPSAAADAVPSVAEPGQQPPDSAARQRRSGRGRAGDRSLRAVRGGRQLRCRLRAVSGADRHSVPGGQPWRGAHRRGHGALHPRCHARQADGDRRRPERRALSTRSRRARAASRSAARPNSTEPWTARRASTSATRWRPF